MPLNVKTRTCDCRRVTVCRKAVVNGSKLVTSTADQAVDLLST